MRRTPWLTVAPLVCLLLLVAGCGGGSQTKAAAPSRSASASSAPTTSAPATVPPKPEVGACYRLSYAEATSPTSDEAQVDCGRPHDAVTIFVGRIDPIRDGHLLAVDSTEIQDQIATACPTKLSGWLGGDADALRLSRFRAIWFSPTLEQSDAGAEWFRCDLVAVRGDRQLAAISDTKGILDDAAGLDRYGTCGDSAPSEAGFEPRTCSEPHSWRAVSVVPIADDAAYLGQDAQSAADDTCKGEAQQRADDPLVYRWSFEWPTRAEWRDGQRHGLCWVPEKN